MSDCPIYAECFQYHVATYMDNNISGQPHDETMEMSVGDTKVFIHNGD